MNNTVYCVVIQSVRVNNLTGHKTLYVLAVKLASNKVEAEAVARQHVEKGFVIDILETELPDSFIASKLNA